MSPLGSKGQGAMEYLMTYAWAILVVLVVGLAMYQLGLFNPGGSVPTYTGWESLQPAFSGIAYYTNGTFQVLLINQEGVPLRITDVTLNEIFSETECTPGPGLITVKGQDLPGSVSVDKGDGFRVVALSCPPKAKNEPYKLNMTVYYTALLEERNTDHVQQGLIEGSTE